MSPQANIPKDGLYLVHLSIHGLIRGENLELGRDPDTGGQTKYVVELCRQLGTSPDVARVDLLTRLVADPKVSSDYAVPLEPLGGNAFIRRIQAGPKRYLRKESLWPYLDVFIDQALLHIRSVNRLPDLIHAHYADAGYVGRTLASLLGCPLVFTGHSLGRVKRQRLIEQGTAPEDIENKYRISQRIEAEEKTLESASLVVTSTRQEVREQYEIYDHYVPDRMRVIPPGIDLSRYSTPDGTESDHPVAAELARFLRDPAKPMVLALARADERKNLVRLVEAFGSHPTLRERANLVVVAGQRDDYRTLPSGPRRVWQDLLAAIDRHDLYGHAAVPKHHKSTDVPVFYRLAAASNGVFVNAALTEPFGLTLLEAAASGLPIVATRDGGPVDITSNCRNGILVDPLDPVDIAGAIHTLLEDPIQWREMAKGGLLGTHEFYSWETHSRRYLEECSRHLPEGDTLLRVTTGERKAASLPIVDRMILSGLHGSLTGPPESSRELAHILEASRANVGFGILTGLDLEGARQSLTELDLPTPDVLITQLGGAIHYGEKLLRDKAWTRHLRFQWQPDTIRSCLADALDIHPADQPGLQGEFKITYHCPQNSRGIHAKVRRLLREHKLRAQVTGSDAEWIDILPLRSSKGNAMRYLTLKWGLPPDGMLVLARTAADATAIRGNTLAVVMANHDSWLNRLRDYPRVYFSEKTGIDALLDGIRYYQFDSNPRIPADPIPEEENPDS